MRNFDGFIFDIDGTLAKTNALIFETFRFVSKKYLNENFTDEDIIKLFGPTEDVILKELMQENYEEARKDYFQFYSENHELLAEIFPGIDEILKIIKEENIPTSIYTGKGKDSTQITLDKLGLTKYFDLIVTGDDIENHKPSPEGIEIFINQFNLDRNRVLMIGDAPADIIASRNANIKCASVLWDSYAKEKVLNMKSDFIFYDVNELKKFIIENI
ncbi:MAG: HAD-IA family hydrolase [Melioribacteraceae bacterium]|nr:HAD-IA family hydrolase [Melioribacteraceae bacterium]